jgi:hypothetical protein
MAQNYGAKNGMLYAKKLFSAIEFTDMHLYFKDNMNIEKSFDRYHITNIPFPIMECLIHIVQSYDKNSINTQKMKDTIEFFSNISVPCLKV